LYLFQLHTEYTVLAVYELDNKTLHWKISICKLYPNYFFMVVSYIFSSHCAVQILSYINETAGSQWSLYATCNDHDKYIVLIRHQSRTALHTTASCANLVVPTQNKKAQCHYVIFPAEHFMHPHRVHILQRTALHCSGRCERLWPRLTKCRLRGIESQKNVSRTAWHFRNARLVRIPFPVFHDVWKG
jgi:hypothetical protein